LRCRFRSSCLQAQANFQTTFTVSTKVPITGLIVNVPLTASFSKADLSSVLIVARSPSLSLTCCSALAAGADNFCLCATTDGLTPATITAINTELDAKLTTLLAGLLNPLAVGACDPSDAPRLCSV
jgi:hypothetical protein